MKQIQITEAKRSNIFACTDCGNKCNGFNKELIEACCSDLPEGYYPVSFIECEN